MYPFPSEKCHSVLYKTEEIKCEHSNENYWAVHSVCLNYCMLHNSRWFWLFKSVAKRYRAFTIWMEFTVVLLDKWNYTFFHYRNEVDWTISFNRNFRMPAEVWVQFLSHGGWTSFCAGHFIRQLGKFFFEEEGNNFFFWLLQHPYFIRETSNQHPHCFLLMYLRQKHAGISNHANKRKHKTKVPITKLNSFSPAGLQLCSNTSANTTDEQRQTL